MAQRPNLIFIMPDQLRADFLSCYGADFIETPNIDRLAERGVRFSQAYSQHPVCVPARASLMTGMDAIKTGVVDNGLFLRPDYHTYGLQTWPEILNDEGYYTAAVGKMHFYPWDLRLGFQYRRSAEDKRWLHIRDDYYHFLHAHGLRKYHGNEHEGYLNNKGAIVNRLPWEFQIDHYVGQEACHFIQQYGNEGPFAMMVGFPGPHCPYDPALEFLEGIDPESMPDPVPDAGDTPKLRQQNVTGNCSPWNGVDYSEFTHEQKRKIRAHYAATVKQIDQQVGEILATLEQQNLLDNTIIIFASDHGDCLGDHNLIGKGNFFQSSFHVPLIVSLPHATDSTTCDDLVALTDVTATLVQLSGAKVPDYMDARPLPCLGIEGAMTRDHLIGVLGGGWMIQEGPWRLSKYRTGEVLLFNVNEDPLEQRNLINDTSHQEIVRDLDVRLTQSIMDSLIESRFPERVYVTDLSQTQAFGREGWQRRYPRRLDDR